MLDWTVGKVLEWSTTYLQKNEVDAPKRTAELLLGYSLSMSRVDLYLRYQQPLTAEELAEYKALLKRRARHEPTQYILGTQEFWSLTFRVDARVLIPRPETECLVEEACRRLRSPNGYTTADPLFGTTRPKKILRWNEQDPTSSHPQQPKESITSEHPDEIEDEDDSDDAAAQDAPDAASEDSITSENSISSEDANNSEDAYTSEDAVTLEAEQKRLRGEGLHFLDLCTGSGAVACALASEFPGATVWASDISEDALEVARSNIEALGFSQRIHLVRGDLWSSVEGQRFDLIVSNPPYIRKDEMIGLQREVRDFEPHLALEAGDDGLAVVRRIAQEAPRFLKPQGWILVEIGSRQGADALALFASEQVFQGAVLGQDYARLDRYVVAQRTV